MNKLILAFSLVVAVAIGARFVFTSEHKVVASPTQNQPTAVAPASSPASAGMIMRRILRMNEGDKRQLIEQLQQKTGQRFTVAPDPTYDVGARNLTLGLQLLAENLPNLKGFEQLPKNVQMVSRFTREQMNPGIPDASRPQRVDIGQAASHKGTPPTKFGYYTPFDPASPTVDAVIWHDYTYFVSPDLFMVLWAHELDHVLLTRKLMREQRLTNQQMEQRLLNDPELMFKIEQTGWVSSLTLYGFLAKGGYFETTQPRPLIDLVIFDLFTQATEAYNAGDQEWDNFIRSHLHNQE